MRLRQKRGALWLIGDRPAEERQGASGMRPLPRAMCAAYRDMSVRQPTRSTQQDGARARAQSWP
jgi:hypothetical protein